MELELRSAEPQGAHDTGGRACPPGRALCLMGPLLLHRRLPRLHIFTFGEKKLERKNYHVLRYEAAAKP